LLRTRSENKEESAYDFTIKNFRGETHVTVVKKDENAGLTFGAALDLMARGDREFLSAFLQVLRSSDYKAYLFETPPMTSLTVTDTILLT
jgi:hypothetical protein